MSTESGRRRVPDPWQAQLTALGAFIRSQRRLADMSLRELAELTSVSNAYLSQIERGLHQPSLRVLRSIATALGVTPEQLMEQMGMAPPPGSAPPATAPPSATPPAPGPDSDTGSGGQCTVEEAIHADQGLDQPAKDALLSVYRTLLRTGG